MNALTADSVSGVLRCDAAAVMIRSDPEGHPTREVDDLKSGLLRSHLDTNPPLLLFVVREMAREGDETAAVCLYAGFSRNVRTRRFICLCPGNG